VFGDVDLSSTKGLETVRHEGPSTIGIDTIIASRGKIPEVFLRGCGVPENIIQYIPSLVSQPIQFYSCFISHSHADKPFARRLHDQLQGIPMRKPPTGEPCAGEPHARFGGRGGVTLPDPYRSPTYMKNIRPIKSSDAVNLSVK
jgi:hypothetical protein